MSLILRSDDHINWICPVNRQHHLNQGVVGWWMPLQNQPGWASSQWLDLTGAHHGTLLGNYVPETDWMPDAPDGLWGSVKFFEEASNSRYVDVGSFSLGVEHTITVWFQGEADVASLLGGDSGPNAGDSFLRVSQAGGFFQYQADDWAASNLSITPAAAGTWQCVSVARNRNANVEWVIDGISRGGTSMTSATREFEMNFIGTHRTPDFSYYTGQIALVILHDRALSPSEMIEVYRQSIRGFPDLLNRALRPIGAVSGVTSLTVVPVVTTWSAPSFSANFTLSGTVAPVSATWSTPGVTPTYVQVETATVAPAVSTWSTPGVTATYVQVETATVAPSAASWSAPAITPTYVQVETATISPAVATWAAPAITPTYVQVETATLAPAVATWSNPSTTAQFTLSGTVAPVAATWSVPAVTATYVQVESGTVVPATAAWSSPAVSAGVIVTASVAPASAAWSAVAVAGVVPSGSVTGTVVPVTAAWSVVTISGTAHIILSGTVTPVSAAWAAPSLAGVPIGVAKFKGYPHASAVSVGGPDRTTVASSDAASATASTADSAQVVVGI